MTRQILVAVLSVLIAAAILVFASAIAARRLHAPAPSAIFNPAQRPGHATFGSAISARPASDKFRNTLGGLLGLVSHSGSALDLKDNPRLNQWLAATGQGQANLQPAQAELPPDLVLPPGATVLLTAPALAPGSQDLLILVRAPVSRDTALEFFRKNADANQWTILKSSANMSSGDAALTIDRGHGARVIVIRQATDRLESMIGIIDAR